MIRHVLENGPDEPLWQAFADTDFGRAAGSQHLKGFKSFVQEKVPAAKVTGTVFSGVELEFNNEEEFTLFVLKWMKC